jgi:hypothetical protein
MESSDKVFAPDEVERARRYHRPLYIVLLVDTTLGLVALSLLVFTRVGSWLYDVVDELPGGDGPFFSRCSCSES